MLNEYDMYLYAAARAWTATIDFLHTGEHLRGVFLTRGTRTQLLGPLQQCSKGLSHVIP